MKAPLRRVATAVVALVCFGALGACGEDVNTSTDPVEVEVGKSTASSARPAPTR